MKSKLSHIPHNQYYPRVHTKKAIELAIAVLSNFLQSAVLSKILAKNWNFSKNLDFLENLYMNYVKEF